jgi:hypothetical protein
VSLSTCEPKHLYPRFAIAGLDIEVKRVKYDQIEYYELAKCLTTSGAEDAERGKAPGN